MNEYSIENTHEALKRRLLDYIETAYLGKNDELREICRDEIEKQGVMWQEPFIESNPAYKTISNGIEKSEKIPENIKVILNKMIEENLGVYRAPYSHQIKSLEGFYSNEELFIATGTGSGKTECFMWPMITKLVNEAKGNVDTWKKRGVRAMMLYPMNALVADQIARLRRMIGSEEFYKMFSEYTGSERRPQFGMYTGRTPYAGKVNKKQDEYLSKTLEKDLLKKDTEITNQLKSMGKFPAKYDLQGFVDGLKDGKHITDKRDAELITRYEMQTNTPDILITNYSMLEYMLMREEEQSIWEDTRRWLSESKENKLLFIIDEAHMYRGASGGEVALLIRRFLYKLKIGRDKIQFILTSASIPHNEQNKVQKFICDLTAIDNPLKYKINIITGEKEEIIYNNIIDITAKQLSDFNIESLHDDKITAIKDFGQLVGLNISTCEFTDETNVEQWLYNELVRIKPMLTIMEKCRGNAISFNDLSMSVFPNEDLEDSKKAISVLLAIAPLAKNKKDQVLFPSRLHMMFRGITGIYVCSNPDCTEINHKLNIPIGKVYVGNHSDVCKCGGKIYELLNDRACGALFLRGFINEDEKYDRFVWNKKGALTEENLKEIHFYLIPNNIEFTSAKGNKVGWLNSIAGRLELDDTHANNPHYTHVMFSTKSARDNLNIMTFSTCPKCRKRHLFVSDFSTKGNEPFFHLVSEQLMIQPPVITDKEKLELTPNAGRKVLLFSDSRQRAATLAKELTTVADEEAIMKALTMAAKELIQWADEVDRNPSMDLLYVVFLKVALEHKLRFFYGEDEKDLCEHLKIMEESIRKHKQRQERKPERRQRKIDYKELKESKFSNVPGLYSKYLLKILCSNFRSFTDLGFCWIEPCNFNLIDEAIEELEEADIDIDEDMFRTIFSSWCAEILTDSYAYDYTVGDNIREAITKVIRFGVDLNDGFSPRYKKLFKEHGIDENKQVILYKQLLRFTQKGERNRERLYLNPQVVSLRFDLNRNWYKCPKCGRVFPFELWGKCVWCCDGEPKVMTENEFNGLSFWRKPIIDAINGKKNALMTRINTEEHTAQLSHKDQRIDTWSTTEEYELRFQNVYIDDQEFKGPVDILSCTTTMEVGIDIGSLTAIGLRNIPPMRENYQQRAGRAGRRGSAISTILTYTDSGPHDSYYFNNPEKIITGEPRYPAIDLDNMKLIQRHLNIIYISDFLRERNSAANEIGIIDFVDNYFEEFECYVKNKILNKDDISILIPVHEIKYSDEQKENLLTEIKKVVLKVSNFKDDYYDSNDKEKSLLDVFLSEGIFPTYSFPRNVVGFSIENSKGDKVEQEPDRSLDMAISEYAPGRILVVNKKTYKSGGIYNFHSKFKDKEHPAKKYFLSNEYYKEIFYCENDSCNWVGSKNPGEICPFCGQESIKYQHLIKPWGFAPIGGMNINEAEAEAEMTYAEYPSYASPIRNEQMKQSVMYNSLKYGRLINQQLIILNKGPEGKGFTVCKDCGAAVPGNDSNVIKKIPKPYRHPQIKSRCYHSEDRITNAFLGYEFLTDMVLLSIELDPRFINISSTGLWIKSASQTLTEAMVLAAGHLLDIEFNDLKGGYRLRYSSNKVYVDIFLFDSLSSGAGYSCMLTDKIQELIVETYKVLDCKNECETACHDCLKHYWNQRVQNILDRHNAVQLLDWCKNKTLAMELPYEQQKKLIYPVKENSLIDADFDILFEKTTIYAVKGSKKKQIYVYPSMWSSNNKKIPKGCIAVSDKELVHALPYAYSRIREQL